MEMPEQRAEVEQLNRQAEGINMTALEVIDMRIAHWEQHLADVELSRRLAIGQLGALYVMKQHHQEDAA